MTIQFNTDNHVSGNQAHVQPLIAEIEHGLKHFSDHITRVEVHLHDENGNKNAPGDKRCMLETRLQGKQPIAVSHNGDSHEDAVKGAVERMKTMLDRAISKMREH